MATTFGAVSAVHVDRSSANVFLHTEGQFLVILWNDTEPVTPAELITRSMWLSLISKSLQEHREVAIGFDDATVVATSVELRDTVVDVARTAAPSVAKQRELIEQLAAAGAA